MESLATAALGGHKLLTPPIEKTLVDMKNGFFFVESRWGGSDDSPSHERLRKIIAELEVKDEEHPDAWLTHRASEWTLRLDEDRVAYLEDSEGEIVGHIKNVAPEHAFRLWVQFSEGGRDAVSTEPWAKGTPSIPADVIHAKEERGRLQTLEGDRRFYEVLGPERPDVPCRRNDCARGAIAGSVFCRVHHFEQIYRKPCPFAD